MLNVVNIGTTQIGLQHWVNKNPHLVLLCSQIGDHLQEDLVKFGYRPSMKVRIF